MKRVAYFLSYLLHPALAPFIALGVVLWSDTRFALNLKEEAKRFALGYTMMLTFVLPLLFLMSMKRIGIVTNYHLGDRRERIIPMGMGVLFYGFNFFFFKGLQYPSAVRSVALAMFAVALIIFLVTFFYKASVHAAGMASLFGGLLAFSKLYGQDLSLWLTLIVVLAGLVGTARLILKAHSESELAMGYFIGFLTAFFCVYLELG